MFTDLIAGQQAQATYHCSCAGCAEVQAQGQVAPGTQAGPVSTAGRIDENAALIAGSRWSSGPGERTVITYSFSKAGSQFDAAEAAFSRSLTEFSAGDKQTTRAVLASIEAVCNVQFVEVPDNGAAAGVLRYGYSQRPNEMGFAGYAFFPSASEVGGNIWIGANQAASVWDYYRPNLVLHETLHAIGLKHPFDGQAVLAGDANIIPNTVMSYSAIAGSQSGALSHYPAQPMALDIKALQELYGVASSHAGNDVYDVASADFQCFRAVWDASGVDTLDASRCVEGVRLDLASGARSDVGAQVRAFAYFGTGAGRTSQELTYTDTLAITPGVMIENAVGSVFNDVLLGNALANVLSGGEGDDLLDGRGGDDTLLGGGGRDVFRVGGPGRVTVDGGLGEDTVVFAGTSRDYSVVQAGDHYTVTAVNNPAQVATLRGVERIEFSDVRLAARPTASDLPQVDTFSAQAFRLYKAALNRTPDQEGLAYQSQVLQKGVSLSDVANCFMASPEFQQRFGAPGNREFVKLLYNNVLGRNPDEGGLSYHVANLEQALTRADVLVGFSESPENQAAVGVGLVGVLYPV